MPLAQREGAWKGLLTALVDAQGNRVSYDAAMDIVGVESARGLGGIKAAANLDPWSD